MAIENVTVKDASGNAQPVAADKIGADYFQVIKVGVGADGAFALVGNENPFPTASIGGATESKQDTAQASLTALVASSDATATDADAIRLAAESIDSKTPSLIGGESQVADAQTRARIGATTDAEATADGTVIAVLKRLRTLLGNIATSVAGTLSTAISQTAPGVSNGVQINAALPTGANVIGAVTNATAANFKAQVQGVPVTPTDKSGTITTGGTAQVAIALNANRRGFVIQNLSAGDLWWNDVGAATAASPSFKIVAGQGYESIAGNCPTTAISIIGATTGQAFAARELT